MLRSNHLQPGMNLNTLSFPTADLTLKVPSESTHTMHSLTNHHQAATI